MNIEITGPLLLLPVGDFDIEKWRHLPDRIELLMTTVNEVAATLVTISNELAKARGEILAKIDALTASLANVELPAEAETALAQLAAQAQALDDIVPDVEPVVV